MYPAKISHAWPRLEERPKCIQPRSATPGPGWKKDPKKYNDLTKVASLVGDMTRHWNSSYFDPIVKWFCIQFQCVCEWGEEAPTPASNTQTPAGYSQFNSILIWNSQPRGSIRPHRWKDQSYKTSPKTQTSDVSHKPRSLVLLTDLL